MLFNTPDFIVFFIVVFALYWTIRARQPQNVLLLVASYVFYGAWSWKFLALLIISTVVDYACGLAIESTQTARRKRLLLLVSVSVNLTLLGTFKYYGFFVHEAAAFLQMLGFQANVPVLQLVLPVGISFYTFQSIGYIVDVYRGKVPAERSPLNYALYVAFFPQLVAGPIERAGHLLPQFHSERSLSRAAFESGLLLILWGLIKKVVVADNLAPYVDAVYADPTAFSGAALATATVFFAFQIYGDFSGYTDIARGVARLLGFELIRNFDHPYISRTPVEFWRRWHMSLSQWFQDYLYFPLAMRYMRRGGWGSKYKAHIVAMGLIGLWHGANWTFVVFGLYWGVVIAAYLYLTERHAGARAAAALPRDSRAHKAVAIAAMFAIVCLGWLFFRAESITQAWYILTHLFSPHGASVVLRANVPTVVTCGLLIAGLLAVEWTLRNRPRLVIPPDGGSLHALVLRNAMIVLILFSYFRVQQETAQPFIYFQF